MPVVVWGCVFYSLVSPTDEEIGVASMGVCLCVETELDHGVSDKIVGCLPQPVRRL